MKVKFSLFFLSLLAFGVFTIFSYSVAKEAWQQVDFDTTVKLQDHLPRRYDFFFSYFSYLGSAEVTIGLAGLLAIFYLIRLRIWAFLAWLLIIPASFFEVLGKLLIFHPAPPVLFHRNILEHNLPSFYIQTNFSYPSGHLTRTIFLVTVLGLIALYHIKNNFLKMVVLLFLIGLAGMMFLTRIYLGEHWLSDTLGGGLLGLSSGLFSGIFILGKKKKLHKLW